VRATLLALLLSSCALDDAIVNVVHGAGFCAALDGPQMATLGAPSSSGCATDQAPLVTATNDTCYAEKPKACELVVYSCFTLAAPEGSFSVGFDRVDGVVARGTLVAVSGVCTQRFATTLRPGE
jgi:hypothetical protein